MKKLFPLLMMSFLLLIITCKKNSSIPFEGQVFFELNYTNTAWGDQFSSALFLADGTIWRYDKPLQETNTWILKDVLTSEEMDQNLSLTDSLETTAINSSDIEMFLELTQSVESELTEPDFVCDDAGLSTIYAFKWSRRNGSYERILLKQCGDQIVINNNPEAKEILEKLTATPPVNWTLDGGCCVE